MLTNVHVSVFLASLWTVFDADVCNPPYQVERGAWDEAIDSSLFWYFRGKVGHCEFLDMKLLTEFY